MKGSLQIFLSQQKKKKKKHCWNSELHAQCDLYLFTQLPSSQEANSKCNALFLIYLFLLPQSNSLASILLKLLSKQAEMFMFPNLRWFFFFFQVLWNILFYLHFYWRAWLPTCCSGAFISTTTGDETSSSLLLVFSWTEERDWASGSFIPSESLNLPDVPLWIKHRFQPSSFHWRKTSYFVSIEIKEHLKKEGKSCVWTQTLMCTRCMLDADWALRDACNLLPLIVMTVVLSLAGKIFSGFL